MGRKTGTTAVTVRQNSVLEFSRAATIVPDLLAFGSRSVVPRRLREQRRDKRLGVHCVVQGIMEVAERTAVKN